MARSTNQGHVTHPTKRRQSLRRGDAEGAAHTTTDHETIRRWVEERGGRPATVAGTADEGGAGLLRIDFPGYSGEGRLEPLSWEDFFAKFEEAQLAFLYQDETAEGDRSRFSKFVRRER
jgi:hypothetical protein